MWTLRLPGCARSAEVMPTYVYEVILANGEGGERFEVRQSMADAPLKEHPKTGQPVRRVIQPPHLPGEHTDRAMEAKVKDDRKLESLGFTKYVKTDSGRYEKTIGKGPKNISSD
jgi:hypothetical protein